MSDDRAINLGEFLTRLRLAYDRMGANNSHKHLLYQAALIIRGLAEDNRKMTQFIQENQPEITSALAEVKEGDNDVAV